MSKENNNTAYIYRYNKETSKWVFVSVSGIEMDGRVSIKVPVEKWTLSTGKVLTLNHYIYSKEGVESMMRWTNENDDLVPLTRHPTVGLFSVDDENDSLHCIVMRAIYQSDPSIKLIASQDNMVTMSSDSMVIHPSSVTWDRLKELMVSSAHFTVVTEKYEDCPSIYRSLTK